MSPIAEDIIKPTASEKAECCYLLGTDEELNNYLFSYKRLFAELAWRDEEYAAGNVQQITKQEFTQRLNERRDGLWIARLAL